MVWDLSFTYRQAYLNQYHTMAVQFSASIFEVIESNYGMLWKAD